MTTHRLGPDDPRLAEILALIRAAFAYMEGRIDPPSSMLRLDPGAVQRQARTGEIWALCGPLSTCIFLTSKPDYL